MENGFFQFTQQNNNLVWINPVSGMAITGGPQNSTVYIGGHHFTLNQGVQDVINLFGAQPEAALRKTA